MKKLGRLFVDILFALIGIVIILGIFVVIGWITEVILSNTIYMLIAGIITIVIIFKAIDE